MLTINKGSIENILVSLDDVLDNVTDITPFNPQYGFAAEFSAVTANQNCVVGPTPMSVFCLVNTTAMNPGRYHLYVELDNPPEYPRIGPVRFKVE
jgi:hypothetical protein